MIFGISLIIAVALTIALQKPLKKYPVPFYIITLGLCILVNLVSFETAPAWVSSYILDLFRRGALGTALFVVVMYAGAFKNGSKCMKILMPIRGQLSIIASILCLCHNVFYGKTYFIAMATHPAGLPVHQLIAGILSILMILIMVPLFIMSFRTIRRKMKGKTWKKIQRLAYGYYAMLYIHICILLVPHAWNGQIQYAISITIYSLIYGVYAVMRFNKTKFAGKIKKPAMIFCAFVTIAITAAAWIGCGQAMRREAQEEAAFMKNAENSGEDQETEAMVMHDGSYIGSGTGYNGAVEVTVVVRDGKIAEIILGDNKEDAQYLNEAVKLFDDVLEQQTWKVDSISGATSSSVGLKSAIKKAVMASYETGDDNGQDSNGNQTSIIYKDGTYTGNGAGYGGKVVMEVDIQGGKITGIRLGDNKEDKPYVDKAIVILDDMLEQQTYDVDTISGATSTSEAMITGVRRALLEAQK